jgi:hypothetical protein
LDGGEALRPGDMRLAVDSAPRRPTRLAWAIDRRLTIGAAIVLGAVALMAPCFVAGHPNIFPDTSAYHLIGQWLAEQAGLTFDHGFGLMRHRRDLGMFFTMAGARSPYYGLLLFFTTVQGSAWAIVAVQALAASALIALTLRVVLRRLRLRHFAVAIAFLTLASTLPYFVSFVMPDVFLGLGALSAILLLVFFDRLTRPERWSLGVFLAVTLTFHATNAPAILALVLTAVAALVLEALPARPTRAALAIVACGLVVSVGAGALYPVAVQALAHRELSRPPFLTARLLADGPGRVYLRKACVGDAAPFAVCRYRALPLTDANDILWSMNPRKGAFEPADHATRLTMTREEPRFVAAVIAAYPVVTLERLAMDSVNELTQVSVLDTLGYSDRALIGAGPHFKPLIDAVRFCIRRPSYCNTTPAQEVSEDVLRGTLIACALYLAARLALRAFEVRLWLHRAPLSPRLAAAVVGVFVLMVVNALVCGALSGVYARYEMRIAWLVPLFAILAFLETRTPSVAETVR